MTIDEYAAQLGRAEGRIECLERAIRTLREVAADLSPDCDTSRLVIRLADCVLED